MKLVIAEKPSVGRSIASIIGASKKEKKEKGYMEGNGYIVTWCIGHLVGLKEPEGKWELETLPFIPSNQLVVKKETKSQFSLIKKLMERSDVDGLVCATDAGREGEAIFRYVYIAAGCKKPFERLWISSMTDEAIQDGFQNLQPGHNYDKLFAAAIARDKADMLVGITGTRLFSLLYGQYKPPLSVGRVQTPTLYMLVKREQEIAGFVSQKSYKVQINVRFPGKTQTLSAVSATIQSESDAKTLEASCRNAQAKVVDVINEVKSTAAPKLYDLTSLQRDCNRYYGYTAQETLNTVQALYEAKLCTYPRTDSQYLTDDMELMVVSLIDIVTGAVQFLTSETEKEHDKEVKKCVNNQKVTDHHAILPTAEIRKLDWSRLTPVQYNVLELICLRLLSATARRQIYESTKIILESSGTAFKTSGKVITDNGFKQYIDDWKMSKKDQDNQFAVTGTGESGDSDPEQEEKQLPAVKKGDIGQAASQLKECFSKPPQHYTEDTLLKAMEHAGTEDITEKVEREGLGSSATRAVILENLISKGYVERVVVKNKKNKLLMPTERAYKLMEVIPEELKSPRMTAEMENTLACVAQGKIAASVFLDEMIQYMTDIVEQNRSRKITPEENPFGVEMIELGNCPNCGKPVRKGKFGAYCTGKCGMHVQKIYGHVLTDEQIMKLLTGNYVTFTSNGRKTIVYPSVVPNSYQTEDGETVSGFQWKTESKKRRK